ncbi:tyrosine-type recombinase/integrase [Streptomyces sp. NPDC059651]|uniref:tyrosine-type recombinase/integrase n=1 Tax=Streptomyces sp. NPDC059651 TaxID=3346897 RepID=UPI0036B16EAF
MDGKLVIDDLRVQELELADGTFAYTILWPEGATHREADGFLRTRQPGTDRTYAFHLVDHLRWLEHEGLTLASATLDDLYRYMGAVGAKVTGPFGQPWRTGKRPYGHSTLKLVASCLKGFYLHVSGLGINEELGRRLDRSRLPTRQDRNRALLGHTQKQLPKNPLTPKQVRRRHPKMAPEGAKQILMEAVNSARDRMVVTWLADGGFRIGELCGLHQADLHLREKAACGQCRSPHVHVVHRPANPNRAAAKTKAEWSVDDGVVRDGLIRRVSPAMIHTYFEYMTCEYPRDAGHGMLLVQQHGPRRGQPWSTDAARGMLRRAGARAELGRVKPHGFRHSFATAVLDASGGDLVVTREAGGWASASTVDEIYAHADVHDPDFARALQKVWGEEQ